MSRMTLDLPSDIRARVDEARRQMEAEQAAQPADDAAREQVLAHCRAAVAGRQLTRSDLAGRLRRRGHPDELVEWAVERCEAAGLVDDESWAREYVASRLARGHGERRIRTDLMRRGIDRSHVDAAVELAGGRERVSEACVDVVRRRYGAERLADGRVKARAMRYLAGRGFDAEQVRAAIRIVQAGEDDAG